MIASGCMDQETVYSYEEIPILFIFMETPTTFLFKLVKQLMMEINEIW